MNAKVLALGTLAALVAAAPGRAFAGPVEVIIGGPDPTPAPHRAVKAKPRAAAPKAVDDGPQVDDDSGVYAGADAFEGGGPRVQSLLRYALSFVGVPYVWGGATPSGFDCSGFTQFAFRRIGVEIPRTADLQFYAAKPVDNPQPGDLVFFQTYEPGPSHVGIYLGSGYFVNSVGTAVQISNFGSDYFASRYLGARRVL